VRRKRRRKERRGEANYFAEVSKFTPTPTVSVGTPLLDVLAILSKGFILSLLLAPSPTLSLYVIKMVRQGT
jgi:hypothetical protein